jgi:hypothetical protein
LNPRIVQRENSFITSSTSTQQIIHSKRSQITQTLFLSRRYTTIDNSFTTNTKSNNIVWNMYQRILKFLKTIYTILFKKSRSTTTPTIVSKDISIPSETPISKLSSVSRQASLTIQERENVLKTLTEVRVIPFKEIRKERNLTLDRENTVKILEELNKGVRYSATKLLTTTIGRLSMVLVYRVSCLFQ